MHERRKSAIPTAITIVAIAALLLSSYIGTYVWSLNSADSFGLVGIDGWAYPEYPVGQPVAEVVFYPAYRVDRFLRPKRWAGIQPVPSIALEDSDQLAAAGPIEGSDTYDDQIIAGSKAHITGDIESAVVEFTKAIETNPNGYDAYLNRGVAHQELGHWSEALADYETGGQCRVAAAVAKGTVTLSGVLQYEAQRRPIVKAVTTVAGVRRVVDQMKFEPRKRQ